MVSPSRQRERIQPGAPARILAGSLVVLAALVLLAGLGMPGPARSAPITLTPGAGTPANSGASDAAPPAQQTGAPAAVDTSQPQPIQTGGAAAPVQTGGPALTNGNNPPAGGTGTTGTSGTTDTAPWLPWLIGAIVVVALAGLGAFALRQRSNPPMATVAAGPPPPLAPVVEPPAGPPPTQIRCPNCDTLNPADRRFCDECGQDLRPAVVAAGAPPVPDVDEATTPYLETLSRVDEQLEFVLARNAVKIGRALDNDIVIDDQFIGWQTVSPHHARLTREADGFTIEDLNSENGTFVNSARTGQNLLEDGMTIALGKVEFIYRVPRG